MDDVIAEIIAEFDEREIPATTRRHIQLPGVVGKIDAVIGVRRSGKTCFLHQQIGRLLAEGGSRDSILYVNFEDERLLPMTAADLRTVIDVHRRMHPAVRDEERVLLFDEIHEIDGWDKFLRRLVDSGVRHICVSGSSAKMLGREISTSLRGRALTTEIFPFSFPEFLDHHGHPAPGKRPGSRGRAAIEHLFEKYIEVGGFPEVQSHPTTLRTRILQGYLDVMLLRDIIERHGIRSIAALRQMTRRLMSSPAGLLSIHKLHHDLRSMGVSVGKDTLHEFLEHLEDAYAFFAITIYSNSERVRQSNPRKVYPVDTGLVRACTPRRSSEMGHLLETSVFLHLRRTGLDVCYYRTRSGREVDFIIDDCDDGRELIQVCADLTNPTTKNREIAALTEAMQETGLDEALLLSLFESGTHHRPEGTIRIQPAWEWMMGSPEFATF